MKRKSNPRYAAIKVPTVDGQIAERGAGGSLDLSIMAAQQKKYRIKCVAADGPHFLLGYLSKR